MLVFLGVFTVTALLLIASGTGASEKAKQALATLDSALAAGTPQSPDQIVDLRKNELLSAIPVIHRWLLKIELAPRLQRLLYQANLKWTAGGMLLISMAACVFPAYGIHIATRSDVLSLCIGGVLGFAPLGFVLFRRKSRFAKFEEGLPEALDMMVSALRVGHSFSASMGLVTRECPDPVGSEFRICFDEQNYGLELKTAMENMIARVPLQDLRMVVTAILIQKESGGNLAEVLDKTASIIRQRFRLKRQVRVHTAQGRLTGWVLTALPIGLGFALYLVNPELMSVLWTRPVGVMLLYIAAGMMVVGGLIIRKIVNMDV
ncbi:MAG: type II secretion system F family protein [Terracidiphilus sp.]